MKSHEEYNCGDDDIDSKLKQAIDANILVYGVDGQRGVLTRHLACLIADVHYSKYQERLTDLWVDSFITYEGLEDYSSICGIVPICKPGLTDKYMAAGGDINIPSKDNRGKIILGAGKNHYILGVC